MEKLKSKSLAELAFDTILVRSGPKMEINWNSLRKRINEFCDRQEFNAVVAIATVLLNAPYFLKKDYREPCLSCMLKNLADGVLGNGEEVGYCSNCTNEDQPVIECKLLSTCVISHCCAECCDNIKLLRS